MKLRPLAVALLAVLAVGACKKNRPVETEPVPVATTDDAAARERARADSIAAAERMRAETERAERERTSARLREALTERIFFDYDSDALTSEAQRKLQAKAAILRANPRVTLAVEGHADERGSTEYNLALGQRRAESVRAFMAAYGIDGGRFETVSYGEERPLEEGSGESAWARNRRAEFEVTGGELAVVPPEMR